LNEIEIDHTHTQGNFRFDANKEYDWDASVAIKPNQNFAPNKDSTLVALLDMKTFSTCAHKPTDLSTFLSQFFSILFFTFLSSLFFDTLFFYN
jgi:hypothetical protein